MEFRKFRSTCDPDKSMVVYKLINSVNSQPWRGHRAEQCQVVRFDYDGSTKELLLHVKVSHCAQPKFVEEHRRPNGKTFCTIKTVPLFPELDFNLYDFGEELKPNYSPAPGRSS